MISISIVFPILPSSPSLPDASQGPAQLNKTGNSKPPARTGTVLKCTVASCPHVRFRFKHHRSERFALPKGVVADHPMLEDNAFQSRQRKRVFADLPKHRSAFKYSPFKRLAQKEGAFADSLNQTVRRQ
jgi:hypothetical protein